MLALARVDGLLSFSFLFVQIYCLPQRPPFRTRKFVALHVKHTAFPVIAPLVSQLSSSFTSCGLRLWKSIGGSAGIALFAISS